MALSALSLITYGIEITPLNNSLPFRASSLGPILNATLNLGFYSPTSIADEVARAMQAEDSVNVYSCTVNRNILGGTQNRLTISTTGTYLDLLFTAPLAPNPAIVVAPIIGYNSQDYTGSTSYVGSQSVGTSLLPDFFGFNYLSDLNQGKVFGAVNVSAAGIKESVVFNLQKFIDIEFKYEPKSKLLAWRSFWNWAIQQRPFDFIPEISDPLTSYQVTLEKTSYEGKGLGFQMKELLPNFPNFYTTGPINMRIVDPLSAFLTG
jgi:hypothetical protein